ncbi:hypothetical protein Ddye_002016 [Dipteronia dyeriana]|uniref:Uncharacterized protein n=1 Tax=Dipteronia dyeriana TaxID=168575 RepID=A0AAD9XQ66_9ROSI|nr:hypothetical protein Ddye_002016 [Dipteronia dyeriana]
MAQNESCRANWSDPTQRTYFIDLCLQEKYPDAKQFRTRPLANFEELETLFSDDEQPTEKKQKKRKIDETREEICKIVSVLEKSDNNGPSMADCFSILKRFLNYKDPLYFIATNALCKRKEYREVWMQMDSDEERLGWIQSLQK